MTSLPRMKLDKADILFSKYIRLRDDWRCVRCQRYDPPPSSLQCSHFYGRRMESVRFDEQNCDTLCYGCHRYWEKENREAYRDFKIRQLGEQGFKLLQVRANTPQKKDRKLAALYYKTKLKELEVL